MRKKVNIITLGCSKNIVDSEKLAIQLSAYGYSVVYDSEKWTDTVVINTCGFIKDAKEESIDTILSAIQAKEAGKIKNVYVIGCLSERYAKELKKEIPEVDAYFGAKGFVDILKDLHVEAKSELINNRLVSTPQHLAYLKIAEGCDRTCAFCAIPMIKGRYTSFTEENLVEEAMNLGKSGVKELILIAQDLSYYGLDISKKSLLPSLVTKLSEIDLIHWIRLHYLYPNNFPMELLSIMNNNPKICKYIDIPFQHITDTMLKTMKRNFTKSETYTLLDKIKKEVPEIALRSTLLVGHPGETEQDFDELKQFVKDAQFDRLGVFTYSHEEKTYADKHYKDDIPDEIKQERADEIMRIQDEILQEKQKNKVGSTLKVIIDRIEGDYAIARSQFDSYEVDTEILINSKKLKIGDFYNVFVDKSEGYDLYGKII